MKAIGADRVRQINRRIEKLETEIAKLKQERFRIQHTTSRMKT